MTDNSKIRQTFALSAQFLEHKTYNSLTHAILNFFSSLQGITEAVSYEVFTCEEAGLVFRRFPITLDESFKDRNSALMLKTLPESTGGISKLTHHNQDYLLLDITKDVSPRRIILLTGTVSVDDRVLVEGVFTIYANQVALLDSKERDLLTGLPNRQTMELTLDEVVRFHLDNDQKGINPSWLVMLDIDHFKLINDNYGHVYGDEVLLHFSELMKTNFRYTDFLFRYGGEEFVVIINNASEQHALKIMSRFHQAVQNHPFPSGRLTVSLGYTCINPTTPPMLHFEQADRALYHAKHLGRNRIISYGTLQIKTIDREDDVELF